eukprot:56172-Chlamydomonas_euryale.AAC.1
MRVPRRSGPEGRGNGERVGNGAGTSRQPRVVEGEGRGGGTPRRAPRWSERSGRKEMERGCECSHLGPFGVHLGSIWGPFGVHLGSVWGAFRSILGPSASIWVHLRPFGSICVH